MNILETLQGFAAGQTSPAIIDAKIQPVRDAQKKATWVKFTDGRVVSVGDNKVKEGCFDATGKLQATHEVYQDNNGDYYVGTMNKVQTVAPRAPKI